MNRAFQIVLFTLFVSIANTAGGGDYAIEAYTIDGGGGRMTGNSFAVDGTLGQPEVHPMEARGGPYSVVGGYWAETDPAFLFSDGFEG